MENIDELISKLARDTAGVRRVSHPFALSAEWLIVAVFYIAATVMFTGVRQDLLPRLHETLFAAEIAALVLILITTSLSAALLSYPDLHQKRRYALAPAVSFALFVAVMFFAWRADSPPAPFPVHSFECTLSITLFSLLPAAWTLYVMRKFASTHANWAGAIALLFAFSTGALWLRLYEQTDSIMHVVEWHYLPMIAIGLIGMRLGRIVLKW